jgi:hypothetical protein
MICIYPAAPRLRYRRHASEPTSDDGVARELVAMQASVPAFVARLVLRRVHVSF